MADTQRDLLDEDGENRALRTFLMQYGLPGLTVGAMRDHMKRSGWGEEYLPFFVSCSNRDTHLTKAGAQLWIRHLLGMEGASRPAEVDESRKPPRTPEEMVAFIANHYNSMYLQNDPSNIVFSLTVHDLLSAMSDWFEEEE